MFGSSAVVVEKNVLTLVVICERKWLEFLHKTHLELRIYIADSLFIVSEV